MFMLTESVNVVLAYIKFIAGFMIVATACRIDENLSSFSFECDLRPSVVRS